MAEVAHCPISPGRGGMSKAEAVSLAESRGIDTSGMTKSEVCSALVESEPVSGNLRENAKRVLPELRKLRDLYSYYRSERFRWSNINRAVEILERKGVPQSVAEVQRLDMGEGMKGKIIEILTTGRLEEAHGELADKVASKKREGYVPYETEGWKGLASSARSSVQRRILPLQAEKSPRRGGAGNPKSPSRSKRRDGIVITKKRRRVSPKRT